MVDTSIVTNIINGEKISLFFQRNKMFLLALFAIGWIVYVILINKDKIDAYLSQKFD